MNGPANQKQTRSIHEFSIPTEILIQSFYVGEAWIRIGMVEYRIFRNVWTTIRGEESNGTEKYSNKISEI